MNCPWFLNPALASSIVMPAGSMPWMRASWLGFFEIFVEISFGSTTIVAVSPVVVVLAEVVDSPDVVVLPGFFDPPRLLPDPLAVWPLADPPPLVLAGPVVGFPLAVVGFPLTVVGFPTPVGALLPPVDACVVMLGPLPDPGP